MGEGWIAVSLAALTAGLYLRDAVKVGSRVHMHDVSHADCWIFPNEAHTLKSRMDRLTSVGLISNAGPREMVLYSGCP